jgi:hypothetical protein
MYNFVNNPRLSKTAFFPRDFKNTVYLRVSPKDMKKAEVITTSAFVRQPLMTYLLHGYERFAASYKNQDVKSRKELNNIIYKNKDVKEEKNFIIISLLYIFKHFLQAFFFTIIDFFHIFTGYLPKRGVSFEISTFWIDLLN